MATTGNTLLLRHLPNELTTSEKEDLLRHFQAERVRVMGATGHMKNTAFASFASEEAARKALARLHQLEVLGSILVVELARDSDHDYLPSSTDSQRSKPSETGNKADTKELPPPKPEVFNPPQDEAYKRHGITYARDTQLHYLYPHPTVAILTNIANALAAHPKFYVQVLHLMNKMNIPAPFGHVTTTPPIPTVDARQAVPTEPDNVQMEEMDVSSTEESEIESDGETRPPTAQLAMKRPTRDKPKRVRKRPKLVAPPVQVAPSGAVTLSLPSDIFEQPQQQPIQRKIQLNLPFSMTVDQQSTQPPAQVAVLADLPSTPVTVPSNQPVESEGSVRPVEARDTVIPVEVGGFGTIEPVKQEKESSSSEDEEMVIDKSRFVSSRELRHGRISSEEMRTSSVFKKYEAGDPSTRLYIKNLSKQTTEEDLLYIFGRYVDLDSEEVKNVWDIRLMKEGRMKGQAFITYPTEHLAKKAVRDTNGYLLHGRPMVVQFARSAKPKLADDGKQK